MRGADQTTPSSLSNAEPWRYSNKAESEAHRAAAFTSQNHAIKYLRKAKEYGVQWKLNRSYYLMARWLSTGLQTQRWPTIATGFFFHLRVNLALPKKVSRCILKVFSPEVYTTSFGGDVKPLVPCRGPALNRFLPSLGPC